MYFIKQCQNGFSGDDTILPNLLSEPMLTTWVFNHEDIWVQMDI